MSTAYEQGIDAFAWHVAPPSRVPAAPLEDGAGDAAPRELPVIRTDDDLDAFLLERFGVRLPHKRCCEAHSTPWDAFHDAYFARSPVSVWKASRGFGGKSFTLALLGLTEALTLRADVNILGGSGEQSRRILESISAFWGMEQAPREYLIGAPGAQKQRLTFGNKVQALMASQASVRGPHPQRLRMDEVDEMKLPILDAAMGQPMSKGWVLSQIVLSSTHQYPNGTMTQILKRASTMGWPVFEWCLEETREPHGYISNAEIERKRCTLTALQWKVEIELQEPSAEGRAIVPEKVETLFDRKLGEVTGEIGHYYEFEPPEAGAKYSTGADWARKVDFTEIPTLRIDVRPFRLVAYERLQRIPWPQMVERFNLRLARYPGSASHDATGGGDVVASLITHHAEGFIFAGRPRADLLANYIKGVENGELVAPYIASMEAEHRYATVDDLYGGGHLPDTIAAMALAYRAATKPKGAVRVW